MFGDSQSFGATQGAPKQARQEEKHTCVPVTVRILQDSIARHADSQEVLIHGVEASIVHLVGAVEGLVKQTAMIEFQVNDASGRMKVRYYGNMDGAADLADGRYVSIVGNLRTSPAAHVSAMSLQPVTSADEISYHMIAVGHAALKLRNPTKTAPSAMVTPTKQTAGLGFGGNTLSPVKAEVQAFANTAAPVMQTPPKQQDLRSSVMDVLRKVQEAGSEEGINISALLGRLAGDAGASAEKVKDVITQLVDDGDVFTTIDEDHFALI